MSLLLFTLYTIDVLAGKAASLAGSRLEWRLGDLGEFLVVLAMAVAFVAGLMLSEDASGVLVIAGPSQDDFAPPLGDGAARAKGVVSDRNQRMSI